MTGVQTCALPISPTPLTLPSPLHHHNEQALAERGVTLEQYEQIQNMQKISPKPKHKSKPSDSPGSRINDEEDVDDDNDDVDDQQYIVTLHDMTWYDSWHVFSNNSEHTNKMSFL